MIKEKTADLHIHTKDSKDNIHSAKYSIEEALAKAAEKGLTAAAITNHPTKDRPIYDYDKTQNIAKREGVILVPADELRAKIKDSRLDKIFIRLFGTPVFTVDILAYGITKQIPEAVLSVRELVDEIHKQNGLAIVAHPSFTSPPFLGLNWYSKLGRKLIVEAGIDGIETFNATVLKRMNIKAQKLADDLKLPATGGSDTRLIDKIGDGLTVFSPEVKVEDWRDVLKAIKDGKTTSRRTSRRLGPSFVQ